MPQSPAGRVLERVEAEGFLLGLVIGAEDAEVELDAVHRVERVAGAASPLADERQPDGGL